ncbi:MAG: hypothetical protein AAF740_09970, partial [Bacteroidota bacterium]
MPTSTLSTRVTQNFPVTYLSAGEKTIKFRITFTDSTVRESHAYFNVEAVSAGARYTTDLNDRGIYWFPRREDNTNPEMFPDPEAFTGAGFHP